jgi:hypothetical protein
MAARPVILQGGSVPSPLKRDDQGQVGKPRSYAEVVQSDSLLGASGSLSTSLVSSQRRCVWFNQQVSTTVFCRGDTPIVFLFRPVGHLPAPPVVHWRPILKLPPKGLPYKIQKPRPAFKPGETSELNSQDVSGSMACAKAYAGTIITLATGEGLILVEERLTPEIPEPILPLFGPNNFHFQDKRTLLQLLGKRSLKD